MMYCATPGVYKNRYRYSISACSFCVLKHGGIQECYIIDLKSNWKQVLQYFFQLKSHPTGRNSCSGKRLSLNQRSLYGGEWPPCFDWLNKRKISIVTYICLTFDTTTLKPIAIYNWCTFKTSCAVKREFLHLNNHENKQSTGLQERVWKT